MMKELAVKHRDESMFVCLDDKSIVPIGEPGKPISTGVRAHNRSLVLSGATLAALDHDFHIHGAVPSVLFKVDIPENAADSFYSGEVHVGVKDKVFIPSSAGRHAAETINILRTNDSADGLSLIKPKLFIYTDGGPDHRTTYWSVQLSYVALFISLDLDMLVVARTAPAQSYNNPAERCMSLLNLALQNASLERKSMPEALENKVRSISTLKQLRTAADRDPTLKEAIETSVEPVLASLKQRFSKLKLHGEHILVHEPASKEQIQQILNCLNIFGQTGNGDGEERDISSCPSLKQATLKLQLFMEKHCQRRTYTFQIRKCDDQHCWYCLINPKRSEGRLDWLPDPTMENDQYLTLEQCLGKETTDAGRPSMNGKVIPTDSDKRHKAVMNAAQARKYITCMECHKRRVVYCRQRLTQGQSRRVAEVEEQMTYTCGASMFEDTDPQFDEVFVREGISCASNIETTYYSGR